MLLTDDQDQGRPTVFVSYSHRDERWKDLVVQHLRVLEPEGAFEVWEDRRIAIGADWLPEITDAIDRAAVAVILISVDFLGSKFILGEEVPRLLKRRAKDGLHIAPLVVRPCAWQGVSWLSAIQSRPKDGTALSGMRKAEREEALSLFALEIRDLLATEQASRGKASFAPEPDGTATVQSVPVAGGTSPNVSIPTPGRGPQTGHGEPGVRRTFTALAAGIRRMQGALRLGPTGAKVKAYIFMVLALLLLAIFLVPWARIGIRYGKGEHAHIRFSGLIAFKPKTTGEGVNHITALMLDARVPSRGSKCRSPYRPLLELETSAAECLQADCDVVGELCICTLDRKEVSIGPDVEPPMQILRREPPDTLPTQETSGDFSYIFNLSRLGQVLNPVYLGSSPPQNLVARMTVPFESIIACGLSSSKDAPVQTVPMDFRALNFPAREDDVRQAVAEAAVLSFRPAYPIVNVTISDFDGGNPKSLTVRRGPISFTNDQEEQFLMDECVFDVSEDFSLFYDLSLNPPALDRRPIPHLRSDLGSGKKFEASECSEFLGLRSYPVTPLVVFNP